VNSAWSSMYMTCRFRSPSSPLSLHQMLFAFCAFFESSLQTVRYKINIRFYVGIKGIRDSRIPTITRTRTHEPRKCKWAKRKTGANLRHTAWGEFLYTNPKFNSNHQNYINVNERVIIARNYIFSLLLGSRQAIQNRPQHYPCCFRAVQAVLRLCIQ
jgi:hypothetical protein